jgi:hypothetical protein
MPKQSFKNFEIEARVGANNSHSVQMAQGTSDQHEVIVTPLSGMAKPTKLRCVRSSGTVVEYDPAPPDAWDYDFGSIDRWTLPAARTANRTVTAGQAPGAAVLQVKEVEVDDGLPQPCIHAVPVDVTVTVP